MGTVIFEAYGKVWQCSYLFYQLAGLIQTIIVFICGWYIGSEWRKYNKRRQKA